MVHSRTIHVLIRALSVLALAACLASPAATPAASPEQIQRAIERAVDYLRKSKDQVLPFEAGMVVYAMLKGGEPPDSPAVRELLEGMTTEKFKNGAYKTEPSHQFYEAGVDMMGLEAADPRHYATEISSIAAFIAENQHERGDWFYYQRPDSGGDTSVSQYAILGLWAAARSGVQIPSSVWSRAADWHLGTQQQKGGFGYHPGEGGRETHTMTVNGVSSLCVARLYLYPKGDYTLPAEETADNRKQQTTNAVRGQSAIRLGESVPERTEDKADPRLKVLKRLNLDEKRPAVRKRGRSVVASSGSSKNVSLGRLNEGIARGVDWVAKNYTTKPETLYPLYYIYGLERMCALAGVETLKGHDWYAEGADRLVKDQTRDGYFSDQTGAKIGTSFAILFLSRATSKLVAHDRTVQMFGGGLMIGGRGLPTNLNAVQAGADGIRVKKLDVPVDQLLSELENPKSVQVEAVQQAIVDSVQAGDREKLIGQRDRLKRLVADPRVEVRRTAIWAMGRCATIHDALLFVKALDDPNLGVVIEANNALCWLSRRPNGFGRSVDPFAELPEAATDKQKEDAARSWRTLVREDWRKWYDKIRPYSERDLPIDLP